MATVSQITEAVYRARFDDQMTAGAASAERALNSLGSAVVATDEKVTRATRSSEAWVRSADPITAAANRAAAAQRNLSAAQEALSADLQAGGERAMAAQRALDALAAKAQSAAAAAKQLETAHVQAQVAIHGMAPAATAASSGYSRLSQAVGQAGFQVQDFFVQVGAGQSALVAFAQQGSQLLGVFGTFGAVAGAALAIGALAAQFAIGKTEAEKFKDALDAQEASYQATLTEAERMQNALRRQGDQYLSAEQAGARYRAGLQGEGENLVRLIDYYGRLTAAQRQAEQVSISAQRVALTSNSDALRREVLSGLSGRIGVAEGGPAFDAGTGTPNLVATNLQALSAGYREATDAALKFRDAGVISVAAFSELLNAVNQARQVGGAENVVLREYEESLIRLLPQVRQYEAAVRQLNTAQQALADNNGAQAQVERMRGVVSDVGGRYQSRAQIRDQRGDINAGLQSGAATAEDIARARSSLEALAEAERGLISPVDSALRGLREQAAVARELEGADRAVAQAMLQVQQAGGGMAAQLEAGRLVMARLNEEFRQGNEALIRNAQGLTAQRNAFGQGATAVDDARLAAQAYAEVTRQLGRAVNEESQEYQTRLALLQDERNIRAEIASAQTVERQGQQLEILRRETELVTAGVAVRERELAVLRERQAILNTPGADINSETSQQRLANAATISNATQQLQRQRTAYDELARVGEQAFDRIGSAITQAFANGGIRAINFGNIAKAVFSEVIQAGLRLAVINPIVNSVFGGNRATLGSISDLAGGSAGGASGGGFSLSSASSLFSNGRSILSGGGLGSFFPGGSAINTGFGFLDAGLNASTGIGSGSALANATATYGEGIGSFAAQGITQASGAAASGLSVAQLLGPAAAIGGGLYGVYSGIQKGGVGGYTGAAGGAISAATGLGMLGSAAGLLPALGALGPIGLALGAALALAGAFMPGQKVSGKGQEVNFNTLNGAKTTYGLGGDRFSQGNQDFAGQLAGGVAQLESALQDKLGFGIDTSIGAGVTSGRKKNDPGTLYLRVGEQRAQFGNDEAGAKAFGETAGRFLLDEFKRVGATGDKGSILQKSGSIEELGKNLDWYESTYLALTKATENGAAAANQFQIALDAAVAPFVTAAIKARELGLAEGVLNTKRDEAIAKLTKQRDAEVANINDTIAMREIAAGLVTGSADEAKRRVEERMATAAAGKEVDDLRGKLESLGLATNDVSASVARLTAVQKVETDARAKAAADAAQQKLRDNFSVAQSAYLNALDAEISTKQAATQAARANVDVLRQAAEGLRDYTRGLALDGNLSPLTMQQRLDESQSQYDALVRQTQTGTSSERARAAQQLQGIAGTRLGIASSFYAPGTEGYNAEYAKVTQGLNGVATQLGTAATVQELTLKAQEASLAVLVEQREIAAKVGQDTVKGLDQLRQTFLEVARAAGWIVPIGPLQMAANKPVTGAEGEWSFPWPDPRKMGNYGARASGESIFGGKVTAGEQLNAANVNALYQQFLGRDAEAGVAKMWMDFNGRGFDLAAALEQSAEFQARLKQANNAKQLSDIKDALNNLTAVTAQGSMAVVGAVDGQTGVLVDASTPRAPVPA
jgi:hypothetical protein